MGIYCKTTTSSSSYNNNGGIGKVSSYGNQEVDMTGDWSYQEIDQSISKHDAYFKKAGKALGIDWRLVAAHCKCESSFNENATGDSGKAKGMWQIHEAAWKSYAPSGHKDKWSTDAVKPGIATEAYINLMNANMTKYRQGNLYDTVCLSLQAYRDGHVHGNSWSNRQLRGACKYETLHTSNASLTYVPKIIKQYQNYRK